MKLSTTVIFVGALVSGVWGSNLGEQNVAGDNSTNVNVSNCELTQGTCPDEPFVDGQFTGSTEHQHFGQGFNSASTIKWFVATMTLGEGKLTSYTMPRVDTEIAKTVQGEGEEKEEMTEGNVKKAAKFENYNWDFSKTQWNDFWSNTLEGIRKDERFGREYGFGSATLPMVEFEQYFAKAKSGYGRYNRLLVAGADKLFNGGKKLEELRKYNEEFEDSWLRWLYCRLSQKVDEQRYEYKRPQKDAHSGARLPPAKVPVIHIVSLKQMFDLMTTSNGQEGEPRVSAEQFHDFLKADNQISDVSDFFLGADDFLKEDFFTRAKELGLS